MILFLPFYSFSQEIIKDLTQSNASSYPFHFINAGNKSFFFAKRSTSEMDLWVTDGTESGTIPLSGSGISFSNNPGFMRVTEQDQRNLMINLGDKLIFKAYGTNPFIGEELWISDGTNAGTHVLKDINPGFSSSNIEMFVPFNDKVIFVASTGSSSTKSLWITDGTSVGTRQIMEISSLYLKFVNSFNWKVLNNKLYFIAGTPFEGNELWVTDGTSSGTHIVKDIAPGSTSSLPSQLIVVDNKIFFQASINGNKQSLFVTDGTANGTIELLNMEYHTLDGIAYNDKLYFRHSAGGLGFEVWESDGTLSGTKLFNDLNPTGSSWPSGFFTSNSLLFFAASKEEGASKVLWKSNGVVTELVQEPGEANIAKNPIRWDNQSYALSMGNYFVFEANYQNSDSTEIWRSNGTSEGTFMLKRLKNGGSFLEINQNSKIGNYFGFHEFNSSEGKYLAWLSDGTPNGTKRVENLTSSLPYSNAFAIGYSASSLFFSAFNKLSGYELYKTNGLSATLIKDLNTLPHSDPNNLSFKDTLNNYLYFTYNNNKNGLELWKTDLTSNNTSLFHEFTKGTPPNSDYQNWLWSNSTKFEGVVTFKDKLYISANKKLYVSNGNSTPALVSETNNSSGETLLITKVGEQLFITDNHKLWVVNSLHSIAEIVLNSKGMSLLPSVNTSVNNIYIFSFTTAEHGTELWRSDGTASGTFLLKDISSGGESTTFSNYYVTCNGKLFFTAFSQSGEGLWITDGTTSGTVNIKSFTGGQGLSSASNFTCLNEQQLIFSGYNSSTAVRQLWKSDGTSSGTILASEILNGSVSASSRTNGSKNYPFAQIENTLLLNIMQNGSSSLYKYDGGNVYIVKPNFSISESINHNGKLYFAGNDYTAGKGEELWESDNTIEGTKLVKDINPGWASSSPTNFYSLNEELVFMASHVSSGQEPWVLRKACPEHLVISESLNETNNYKASKSITGEINNLIHSTAKINYQAGDYILINPGFETLPGTVFQAILKGCEQE